MLVICESNATHRLLVTLRCDLCPERERKALMAWQESDGSGRTARPSTPAWFLSGALATAVTMGSAVRSGTA